jgi:hypothetical protein
MNQSLTCPGLSSCQAIMWRLRDWPRFVICEECRNKIPQDQRPAVDRQAYGVYCFGFIFRVPLTLPWVISEWSPDRAICHQVTGGPVPSSENRDEITPVLELRQTKPDSIWLVGPHPFRPLASDGSGAGYWSCRPGIEGLGSLMTQIIIPETGSGVMTLQLQQITSTAPKASQLTSTYLGRWASGSSGSPRPVCPVSKALTQQVSTLSQHWWTRDQTTPDPDYPVLRIIITQV